MVNHCVTCNRFFGETPKSAHIQKGHRIAVYKLTFLRVVQSAVSGDGMALREQLPGSAIVKRSKA